MLGGARERLRIALGALALVLLVSAVLMVVAGQRLTRVAGAGAMRADAQGHIWLLLDGTLLRLSPDGAIETRLDPEALGLGRLLSLAPLPDGRLWVGSKTLRRLFLLDARGRRQAEAAPPAAGSGFVPMHMVYEPLSDRLIVADTPEHRVFAFKGGGEYLGDAGSLSLAFPNELVVDPQGQVLLADTNHYQVLRLRPDLGPAPAGTDFQAPHFPYRWPVFLGMAQDTVYVSWHEPSLRRGKVLRYAADGRELGALALEPEVEPQGLLARDGDVLLALQRGHEFELRRFDRSGQDQGAFGSAEVGALLAAASTSERRLRAAQMYSRRVLLLGAVLLLLGALRLRRRQELAASLAVMAPRPGLSRGMLLQIVLLVVGLFVLLMVVQLFGLVFTTRMAITARHTDSIGMLLAARAGMPLLVGLSVYGVALAWRATPSFVAMQNSLMRRRAQAWGPYLPRLLRPGEQIEDVAVAPSLWRGYLLLLTTHRLALLPATPASSRVLLWQAPWHQVSAPRIVPRLWWRWLINPVSLQVEVAAGGMPRPLRISSLNGAHARELIEAVRQGQERAYDRTQLLPELTPQQRAAAAAAAAPELPPVARSLILSLLFPGLGHFDQGRTRFGMGLIGLAILVLGFGLMLAGQISLLHPGGEALSIWLVLALLYAPLLGYAAWDVLRYARQDRLAAAAPVS